MTCEPLFTLLPKRAKNVLSAARMRAMISFVDASRCFLESFRGAAFVVSIVPAS